MGDSIESVPVLRDGTDEFNARWGTTVYDYKLNDRAVDFQDLMVAVSEHRATAVEAEVEPLSTRIRKRNDELEQCGSLLSIFSETQSHYASDASGDTYGEVNGVTDAMLSMANEAYVRKGGSRHWDTGWWNVDNWTKASVDGMVSILKSMIDERNNAAQSDMTRLQSLVDRRDESYNTASTLMTSVSDTRSNAIRNM